MDKRALLSVLFCLLLATSVSAQSYYFRHYQVENGLSHNTITCSVQDHEGFMWFGTKDGLNRFDGYSFKIFRNDPQDSTTIGSNFIQNLYELNGTLWVGTDGGLYKYNPQLETFEILPITLNHTIRDITSDHEGNLWFIAGYTLYKYQTYNAQLIEYETEEHFFATSVCSTPNGSIWVSTREGFIQKYDPKYNHFTAKNLFDHSPPTPTHWIERLYSTTDNTIYAGTQSQGIKVYHADSGSYEDLKMYDEERSALFVRDFVQSTENELWIASESGIYIYNISTGSFTNLTKSYNNPYSLSDNAIYTVTTDREGGVWAGTYFGGLNYYQKQYTSFEKYFPKIGENSISGNAVREICEDKYGNIWIGTEDAGLNKLNPDTGEFTNFMPTGQPGGLAHYNIHGLLATGDELWVGTFHHGLDVLDIRTGKVIRHYSAGSQPGTLQSNFIYSIIKNANNEIVIGTSNGLFKYNESEDNFLVIPAYPDTYEYTVFIMEDHEGIIWAGTYNQGVYYVDPKAQKKGYFVSKSADTTSLSSNFINSIFEDSHQQLWFATSDGLSRLNRQDSTFKRFTTANGLPSNVIYSIEEAGNQDLWVSTSKGLVKFNPKEGKTRIYTTANGLLSDQFNYNSSYKSPEGDMYFGSVKGMIRFNPTSFKVNQYIPPIHITGFQINNKEVEVNQNESPLSKSITHTSKITLDHNQSSFSIDFAALSYTAPTTSEYEYQMQGLSDEWTYLKTNRKVYFTELAPGNYTFKVKASNSSGIWNKKATILHIKILPPIWASTWAYILYVAIIIVILYFAFKYYHQVNDDKNQQKINHLENEKEKEIYEAKIKFFTNVAHEIRTPLTLITGPLEKVLNSALENPETKDSLVIMKKNTNRLLELTNELLDFRRTEIKQFSLTFIRANVKKVVEEVVSRFKSAIEERNLQASINLPHNDAFAYVDPEALTKIVSNLLNNAVKYADQNISIQLSPFTEKDPKFFITVSNDGHIIPLDLREKIFEPFMRLEEDQKGTGIGLSLARSLAELHKGNLFMDMEQKSLNSFILSLPVHQEKEFKLFEDVQEAPKEVDIEEIVEEVEPETSTDKPMILIVEDHTDMKAFVTQQLEGMYQILGATNGKQALEVLSNHNVSLVISDIMMPVMDGLQLCQQIKTNVEYSHIPIILLTAKNSLQSRIEGLETGADAYIEKPFSVEHLKVQVANLLANKDKVKQYFSSTPLAHIKSMAHSKADEQFLEKLNNAIYANISDSELNVDYIADTLNMSRPTLYRKIKAVSNLTPNELINLARLKKAAELLSNGDYKIYEVAEMVGYNSQTSFGRNFQKQFGMTPSEFITKN
ncbi:hybrid sensor histidine kinase/response regulator transcription factor [Fulvivirga ligni]|uniref:hybrid sensor histidine kinase/response regulator transcription factor n=1 Tax=Fulvivirga ligni TaxID=2904246 RepID=UPI001F2047C1|nr:hybrid sensor histidine kinase/response regulator transcription factor [Fulvivirga ligni]UII21474.1 response regulator [Fulvivirga ligni]